MIGQTLGHYRIEAKLGEGGMGVLYRARDTHLDRPVAIKLLRPEAVGDQERKRRFVLEAKAASALNHPNIITIYDIDQAAGVDYIAMEFVDGRSLAELIPPGGLPIEDAIDYAVQTASALAAAHQAGIVHRDIKPPNLMVTRSEPARVKVLDFGLAKLSERAVLDEAAPTLTAGQATLEGAIVGTIAYMSPEQAEGKRVDARSDVFSFGVVLYEMLAGRRPFQGDSSLSTLMAVLREAPPPLDLPAELDRILRRCLEKDPEQRYPSAVELWRDLRAYQARLTAPVAGLRALLRRPIFALPLLTLLIGLAVTAVWFGVRGRRVRWARHQGLPEITALVEKGNFAGAWRVAREVERYLPEDPQLRRLQQDFSVRVSIRTTPPGAEVSFRPYAAPDAPWEPLGLTPLDTVRTPTGHLRWRITKPGCDPVEAAFSAFLSRTPHFTLHPAGTAPLGMVPVPGGSFQLRGGTPVELQDYWLDKYEVANRQFQEFVNQGGYRKREYWKYPFITDGRTLSWDEAMAELRDATGRISPSTWELGAYPEGQADLPVTGVSWYEAAAYAEFAGKSLPTVYHWYKAAGLFIFADILRLSNFAGKGPVAVGTHHGLSPYGTYDMAGNVKEWCWNATGGRRYLLGGAWNEPNYMFQTPDAHPPLSRSATFGFRCAKYQSAPGDALTGPLETISRDYTREKPAPDDVFRIYHSLYSYERSELDPAVQSLDETSGPWRREKVTFNAAYGNERVIVWLFLPKNAAAPYQGVIFMPGAGAVLARSSEDLGMRSLEFFLRSGRAVVYPIYKGTYERGIGSGMDPQGAQELADFGGGAAPTPRVVNLLRDLLIQWSKDLRRTIDYLETRSDIDRRRLAYYGLSMGAIYAPYLLAGEDRLKTAVLVAGGLLLARLPPEVEAIHFAPRARVPLLMLNGRNDFVYPVETAQLPMFRLWGAPEKDKRHVLFDSGHVPAPQQAVIKEVLDWLDRYLGPVQMR